jgi:hypothetical protein
MKTKGSNHKKWIKIIPCLLATVLLTACGKTVKPGVSGPMVSLPTIESAPRPDPIAVEEMAGEFVSFGKLRTVVRSKERIIDEGGKETEVREIGQALERALVQRDFRIFSGAVAPATTVAEITRRTGAHLIVDVDAKSEFVNSTGEYTRYRASADVKAVRGRDGTILASNRLEENGPRRQDSQRAGRAALDNIAEPLVEQLIRDLFAKSNQLLWAGIVINQVPSMEQALYIQRILEQKPYIDHVELLTWDRASMIATYEIIYGLKHEADIATLLAEIPRLRIRPSNYEPGRMDVLRRTVSNYK